MAELYAIDDRLYRTDRGFVEGIAEYLFLATFGDLGGELPASEADVYRKRAWRLWLRRVRYHDALYRKREARAEAREALTLAPRPSQDGNAP